MLSNKRVEQIVHSVKQTNESITDTKNEVGGFWFAIKTMNRDDLVKAEWNRAFITLKSNFMSYDEKTIRNFLDSQYGRTFADLAISSGLSYEFVIEKTKSQIKKQLEMVKSNAHMFEGPSL